MGFIFICITFLVCLLLSYYMVASKKNIRAFVLIFFFTLSSSSCIYFLLGNIDSFSFYRELEKEITTSKDIDPEKFIIFLEKKIKENPKDLKGIKILARTCLLAGYIQKSDFYYNMGLNYFPQNEDLLFEVAVFKKSIKKFRPAILIAKDLIKINPDKSESILLLIDLYLDLKDIEMVKKELASLRSKTTNNQLIKKVEQKIYEFHKSSKK